MKAKRFDELVARVPRLGQGKGLALKAARLHLVKGLPIAEAAKRAGVSVQAADQCVKRVPRETCPHCGNIIVADQPE